MTLKQYLLVITLLLLVIAQDEGEGEKRLRRLRERTISDRGIIAFTA